MHNTSAMPSAPAPMSFLLMTPPSLENGLQDARLRRRGKWPPGDCGPLWGSGRTARAYFVASSIVRLRSSFFSSVPNLEVLRHRLVAPAPPRAAYAVAASHLVARRGRRGKLH